jgi:hypothetical protein
MAVSRVWVRFVLALSMAACHGGGKTAPPAPDGGVGPATDAAVAAKGLTSGAPAPSLMEDLPAPVAHARLRTTTSGTRFLASGRRGLADAIVAGAYVYFASEPEGTIQRVPLAGGRFETIARGQASPVRLARHGAWLYWLDRGVVTADGHAGGGTMLRAPLAGGPPQVIATGLDDVVSFALDGGDVVVATRHEVVRLAEAGARRTSLATGLAEVSALAVAPAGVFVATQGDATIWRLARAPGGQREAFVEDAEHVVALLVDGPRLLWVAHGAANGEGQVAARPLAGGTVEVIAGALDRPRAAAVAPGGRVAWIADAADGRDPARWSAISVREPGKQGAVQTSMTMGARKLVATVDGWVLASASEVVFAPFAAGPRERVYTSVAAAPGQPRALAVDARAVYWISYQGAVMKAPRAGGPPVLLAHAPRGLSSMALEGGQVVWTSYDAGRVGRVDGGSGAAVDLATGRPHPIAVAARAGEVYFVDDEGVQAVDALGGPVRRLAALGGTPHALAVDDEAAFVLVTGPGGDRLVRVPLAGGSAEVLASGLAAADQLVVDGEWIYVLDEEADADFPNARGQIWRTPRRGPGHERERLAAGLMSPNGLAVGGGYAFFASADGRIGRVPVEGGSVETVAGGGRNVGALCPDGADVLVASGGTLEGDWKDGAILRLALGRPQK